MVNIQIYYRNINFYFFQLFRSTNHFCNQSTFRYAYRLIFDGLSMQLLTLTGVEDRKRECSNRSNAHEFQNANEFYENSGRGVKFAFLGCWNVSNTQAKWNNIFNIRQNLARTNSLSSIEYVCWLLIRYSTFKIENIELKPGNGIISSSIWLAKRVLLLCRIYIYVFEITLRSRKISFK